MGAVLRPCVPLFVMITGALLLPVREDAGPFYRKRIGRVFWLIVLGIRKITGKTSRYWVG